MSSYSAYRMLFQAWIRVSVVSCMDMGVQAWPWREIGEIVYHEECIYTARCTAIALQSIRLFRLSFRALHSFFVNTKGIVYFVDSLSHH